MQLAYLNNAHCWCNNYAPPPPSNTADRKKTPKKKTQLIYPKNTLAVAASLYGVYEWSGRSRPAMLLYARTQHEILRQRHLNCPQTLQRSEECKNKAHDVTHSWWKVVGSQSLTCISCCSEANKKSTTTAVRKLRGRVQSHKAGNFCFARQGKAVSPFDDCHGDEKVTPHKK